MKKYIRKHLKDEKRILKLMYKKGIFDLLHIDLKSTAWECLKKGKKLRKRKGKREYGYTQYLPELHVFSCDYWGEWDSRSVLECYKDYLWYAENDELDEYGHPINKFNFSTSNIIKHLQSLPTKINNGKINYYLKINE